MVEEESYIPKLLSDIHRYVLMCVCVGEDTYTCVCVCAKLIREYFKK